jgi:LacI family transcriptional regulator
VPDEIAVIGIDNDQLICNLTKPALSSISINQEQAGFEAACLLDKLMNGENPDNQTIIAHAVRAITRQSTDIVAVEDPDVSAAVRFIRENARKPIQVTDVIENTGFIGRRAFEKKFRKFLNRSILDEIKNARITNICNLLLLDTNLSIAEIALMSGFSSPAHIAGYFREIKGMNPAEYRKKYKSS